MYDYNEAMKADVLDYIRENYTGKEIKSKMEDRDSFAEDLNDSLWCEDSVTGNASGSYTFSREKARENISGNEEALSDALREFCVDAETIADKFLSNDWEYFDVTLRCYLLGGAIEAALDEIAAA